MLMVVEAHTFGLHLEERGAAAVANKHIHTHTDEGNKHTNNKNKTDENHIQKEQRSTVDNENTVSCYDSPCSPDRRQCLLWYGTIRVDAKQPCVWKNTEQQDSLGGSNDDDDDDDDGSIGSVTGILRGRHGPDSHDGDGHAHCGR